MHVVVTGSSGLLGSALVSALETGGHTVTRLVRRAPQSRSEARSGPGAADEARWDPTAGTVDPAVLVAADAVVHFAGEGIGDHRWTAAHKQRVLESRVRGTTVLAEAISALPRADRPGVLVSGSAVGYYGDRGDEVLTESSPPGSGFLSDVVLEWEAATKPAEAAGVRVVHLRTGIVLSATGGAMGRLIPLFRLGLGGRLGPGRQYWSWVSLPDHAALVIHALTTGTITGAMNATGPEPVTNAELTHVLARVLHRPAVLAVPSFALRLAMGREMAAEMILGGQRVVPKVALDTGFAFEHPTIEAAFRAVLSRPA